MFETTHPGARGMTAQAPKARVKLIRGARRKTILSAPAGMTISLRMNFMRSAKDCQRPNGPTTLGPLRICTPAQILRSASMKKAWEMRSQTRIAAICRTVITPQPTGVAKNPEGAIRLFRRQARRAARQGRALGHGHARPADRIGEVERPDRAGKRLRPNLAGAAEGG